MPPIRRAGSARLRRGREVYRQLSTDRAGRGGSGARNSGWTHQMARISVQSAPTYGRAALETEAGPERKSRADGGDESGGATAPAWRKSCAVQAASSVCARPGVHFADCGADGTSFWRLRVSTTGDRVTRARVERVMNEARGSLKKTQGPSETSAGRGGQDGSQAALQAKPFSSPGSFSGPAGGGEGRRGLVTRSSELALPSNNPSTRRARPRTSRRQQEEEHNRG